MSLDKTNETNSLSINNIKDNNKLNTEQIVKKNKIINIRIYQNYSSNKNSNTYFDRCTNNFFNINNLTKNTNEIGTQTDGESENNKKKKIIQNNLKKNKEYYYKSISQDKPNKNKSSINLDNIQVSKSYSYGIKNKKIYQYNKKPNNNIRKNGKIIKNYSYNFNNKKEKLINKNDNKKYKGSSYELYEIFNDEKKSNKTKKDDNNIIYKDKMTYINNNNNNKNVKNNLKTEKNQIAKKYCLFNLKNDNAYTIINDGYYNSNYKENYKISINNIYLNGKSEQNNYKYVKRFNPVNEGNNLNNDLNTNSINYFCKTYLNNNKQNDNIQNNNTKFNLDENRKIFNRMNNRISIPETKILKGFKELSIVNCNNIFIYNIKNNKNININENIYLNNNNSIKNLKNSISDKSVNNKKVNIKKSLCNYIDKDNNHINKELQKNNLKQNKTSVNSSAVKHSMEILNPKNINIKKITNEKKIEENSNKNEIKIKIKNNINNNINIKPLKYKEKVEKKINDQKLKNNTNKLKDFNKFNIKIDSFLQDITKEEENDILFEDLLKTYSEESDKDNKKDENQNNEIIGDEKTFFNTSKIPKIEEFKFIQKNNYMSLNPNNLNKIKIEENSYITNENSPQKINKPNLKNILDKIHNKVSINKIDYTYEYEFLNKLTYKRKENIFQENKLYDGLIKQKKLIKNNRQYKSNLDDEYQKIINKEKMYNFIFNDRNDSIPYNKELRLDKRKNENFGNNKVKNIINKLNTEIKTSSTIKFYNNYNQNNSKTNNYSYKYKNNRRNKSCKNSYSKYYLNKLEMENKFLIPQLNKKNVNYFY